VYQLIAWSCGLLHDQIEQNEKRILHAILALASADSRGYFYFMMAVAVRLPSPFKEHVMNEFKDYRFVFPIHDHEIDLVEKGERQGIEKGLADGSLQHAWATLERLDPAAAAQLGPCAELRQWDAAIDHAIRRGNASCFHRKLPAVAPNPPEMRPLQGLDAYNHPTIKRWLEYHSICLALVNSRRAHFVTPLRWSSDAVDIARRTLQQPRAACNSRRNSSSGEHDATHLSGGALGHRIACDGCLHPERAH
jgi:hypothetical protein